MTISDSRRLVIGRIDVTDGRMVSHHAGYLWQNHDGTLGGSSAWIDLLVPSMATTFAQAAARNISVLEWIRQRLVSIPYISVEVV